MIISMLKILGAVVDQMTIGSNIRKNFRAERETETAGCVFLEAPINFFL